MCYVSCNVFIISRIEVTYTISINNSNVCYDLSFVLYIMYTYVYYYIDTNYIGYIHLGSQLGTRMPPKKRMKLVVKTKHAPRNHTEIFRGKYIMYIYLCFQ